MEQHRGYITVDSRIGAGSTFGLYFPLVADDLEATAPILAPPVTTANRWYGATILVVDDEPSVRRITRRVLEGVGYRVRSAPDGAVALDVVAREGTPDLVVTDLMMPGIGGAELSRRLRLEYPALPVLFMSGFSAEHVQQQWGLDCDGSMLQKPFTPAELIARIAGVLSRVAKPRGSGR
jgi:two-component system cell cycle sensor histidine kinase/response regulator CckA